MKRPLADRVFGSRGFRLFVNWAWAIPLTVLVLSFVWSAIWGRR